MTQPLLECAPHGRQVELEAEHRGAAAAAGDVRAAEYATATLVAVGDDRPLVDHAADAVALAVPPVHQAHRLLPQLGADDFIGRTDEPAHRA